MAWRRSLFDDPEDPRLLDRDANTDRDRDDEADEEIEDGDEEEADD